jgi:hypothetical protein
LHGVSFFIEQLTGGSNKTLEPVNIN